MTQRNTFNKNNNIIPTDDLYNEIDNKKEQSSKLSNYGESPKNYDNNTLELGSFLNQLIIAILLIIIIIKILKQ